MMAPHFDSLRAAREELAGLNDVHRSLTQRERAAEEAMSVAESELNAIRKLSGYCHATMDTLRKRILNLEMELKE